MTKKLTRDEKIDQVVEWVAEASLSMAQDGGGYPDDVGRVGDHVIVATCVENEPSFDAYTAEEALRWYADIRRSMREYPEEDIVFHVNENVPSSQPEV